MEDCLEYPRSHGGAVCLPWTLSAWSGRVQYGFLWNIPAYGAVNFSYTDDTHAARRTTWVAQGVTQLDYFIATSSASAARDGAVGITRLRPAQRSQSIL